MQIKHKLAYVFYMLHICGVGWIYKYYQLILRKISSNEYDKYLKQKWKAIIVKVNSHDDLVYANELNLFYNCCAKQTYEKGDIFHPQTFNEKLQYLKAFEDKELRTKLSDKYEVRKWVGDRIGIEYLVPLYGVWNNPEDIDFQHLPDSFVLKTNHGSGEIIIVNNKDTMHIENVVEKLSVWLSEEYGLLSFENQYWNIEKRIIAEQLLVENGRTSPLDYKFYCFNGVPKFIHLISDRDNNNHTYKSAFYDAAWNIQEFDYAHKTDKKELKPDELDEMIQIAEKLSKGFHFVRVDLYCVSGKIYFGEMTFSPAGGLMKWNSCTANKMLGELIKL